MTKPDQLHLIAIRSCGDLRTLGQTTELTLRRGFKAVAAARINLGEAVIVAAFHFVELIRKRLDVGESSGLTASVGIVHTAALDEQNVTKGP
ncbi:MAG: hypothetical protein AB7O65_06125 [Candidatus Korobacteraceae bacterium]